MGVAGGDFLGVVAEGWVLFGVEEDEGAGVDALDGERAGAGSDFDDEGGVLGPGELGGGRCGFNGVAGGEVVGDLVDLLLAVVEIDGVLALVCGDELGAGIGLEEEGRGDEALAGDGAEGAVDFDEGGERRGGVVEGLEVV